VPLNKTEVKLKDFGFWIYQNALTTSAVFALKKASGTKLQSALSVEELAC